MEIYYKPSVYKQLRKIPKIELKKIFKKLEILKHNPYIGKQLRGEFEGMHSIKPWPYRIVYQISPKGIIIHSIAHRQRAYK